MKSAISSKSISQRKAGILLSYAGQGIHILSGLIYTPIMLRLLGQSEYGLYQLVQSVVSYLGLLSLGFNASYMRFYAREKARDNEDGVAKLNGMFMLIFLTISMICILCGSVMIGNIRHIFGKGFTESEYGTARILMGLMIFSMAVSFPNSVFTCIVTSQERFIFQKLLILLQSLLNPFLSLPLLLLGYGSTGMVAVSTFLTVCVFIVNGYYCIKKLHAKFSFNGLQFSLLKEMWVFTFFIFLNQIIDQINWSVDKFILGRFAGTIGVAVYSVGSQLNNLYVQLSSSVSNVFVPLVNKIVAETDDRKELTDVFTKVGRIQFMIMMLILTGFIFFGKLFIRYWAGEGYNESYYITLLLLIPVSIPLIQNIGIEIQRAKNKHKARSVVYFFIAVSNILMSIPLIKLYGPIGAGIGTCVSLFLGNGLFMNWYYYRKIDIDIPHFWKSILSIAPALLFPVIYGIICVRFFPINSMLKLFLQIGIYGLIYAVSMFFFGMNKQEKGIINKPLRKIRGIFHSIF